jgi:hypothetical protein
MHSSNINLQEYLQSMYKEQCDQARQHEALRATGTTLILTLAGAMLTVGATVLEHGSHWKTFAVVVLGFFIIAIGWSGRTLSLKHHERSRRHASLAQQYRLGLEGLVSREYGKGLRDNAETIHRTNWRNEVGARDLKIIDKHLFRYWLNIYLLVMLSGLVLVTISLAAFSSNPSTGAQ